MKKGKTTKSEEQKKFEYKKLVNVTIASWVYDPRETGIDITGKQQIGYFINPDKIQLAIDTMINDLEGYAWILHDKDIVSEKDYEKYREKASRYPANNPMRDFYNSLTVGSLKPQNVHILLHFKEKKQKTRLTIANKFGCATNVVKGSILGIPGCQLNSGALLYLLHANAPEKHQYSIEEVHSNPKLHDELCALLEERKSGKNISLTIKEYKSPEEIVNEISNGKLLAEVYKDNNVDKFTYVKNLKYFRDAEAEYRRHKAKMPEYLLNIYIEGESGTGKTSVAKMIARYLYPHEEDPFFAVGARQVAFQNYAGQKVLIWDDITPVKLLDITPTGDIQEMLDPHQQEKVARNIKHSYVILTNEINIFTSTFNHFTFFNALITNDTPKEQIFRRFPIVIEIKQSDICMLINKGIWTGKPELWTQYDSIPIAKVNLAQIMHMVPNTRLNEVLGAVLREMAIVIRKLVKREVAKSKNSESAIYDIISNIGLYKPNNEYITDKEFEEVSALHHHNVSELDLKASMETEDSSDAIYQDDVTDNLTKKDYETLVEYNSHISNEYVPLLPLNYSDNQESNNDFMNEGTITEDDYNQILELNNRISDEIERGRRLAKEPFEFHENEHKDTK